MVIAKRAGFSRGFSLYLDLMRVSAALAVVLYHAAFQQNGGDWFHPGTIGPDAVTVFFVLSVLVISYVVATKESSPHFSFSGGLAQLRASSLLPLPLTFFLLPSC